MFFSPSAVLVVLSQWAHFTVHRFICVLCFFFHTAHMSYYCEHGGDGPDAIEA